VAALLLRKGRGDVPDHIRVIGLVEEAGFGLKRRRGRELRRDFGFEFSMMGTCSQSVPLS